MTTVPALFGLLPSETPGLEVCADLCLRYFSSVTPPVFNGCEPTSLWDYMKQEVCVGKSLRSMAIALGHEHRKVMEPAAPVALHASLLYDQAVRSLRQAITDVELEAVPNRMIIIVFDCLLLHGLRIASQALHDGNDSVTTRFKECFRLLKQYSIAVTFSTHYCLADLSSPITDDSSLRTDEQDLVLGLIGMTLAHMKPQTHEDEDGRLDFSEPLGTNAALVEAVIRLGARQSVLERAMKTRACLAKKAKARQFQLTEARCMLLGIYLGCRWSGHTCVLDIEYDMFACVVDKIEKSLKLDSYGKLACSGADSVQAIVPAFFFGLDTVAPLLYVAMLCQYARLRWTAVELPSCCLTARVKKDLEIQGSQQFFARS
nr:hypothetical protein CFP56_24041 [Quercus suber]